MDEIRETEKKYCFRALTIAIAVATACFIFACQPLGKGLLLGAIFSIVNFILMGETLPMRVGHSRRKSTGISLVSLSARYALLAIPLALAIKSAEFNLAATICGLFIVQAVIFTEHAFYLILTKYRKPQLF